MGLLKVAHCCSLGRGGVHQWAKKWCTLLLHNLNRTKNTSETTTFLQDSGFVVKQQKPILLLGGENKTLIGHIGVFWIPKVVLF